MAPAHPPCTTAGVDPELCMTPWQDGDRLAIMSAISSTFPPARHSGKLIQGCYS